MATSRGLSSSLNLLVVFLFTLATSFGSFVLYSSFFFVLVPRFNLSITWNSAVSYLTVIIGLYMNVAVGSFGDRVVSRFGQRRPIVVIGYAILCVAFVLMAQLSIPLSSLSTASDTNLIGAHTVTGMDTITDDTVALEGWFALYQIIAAVGFGVFQIPYNSWFLDSCRDSDDYAVFQLYCFNIGGAVGSLLGIASFSYMPAKAMTVAAVVFVAGGAPLLALMCWLLPNNTVVSPQPQLATNSKKNIVSAAGDADSNSGDVISAILPSLRILMKSSEFRVLFLNNVILQVGEGIGTEFVAFAPYILFPGVTHYHDLLQLASLFFFVSIGLSAVLTACIGPAIQYYQVDKARIYSGIIIAFIVVCVLEFALCIPGIIITVDADNSLTRGVEESFTAAVGRSKAMGLVYTYIALQILLSALFAAGKVIFSLMMRDLIKLDTVMASSGGKSRASLYQAALGVPSRLLVVFLMVIPQLVFYSSGYKVVDNYDTDDYSHDDLITNKYSWTSASFFELVLFQNVLSGLLAWASYVVIRDYKLNREVCKEVDALCSTNNCVAAAAATGGGGGGGGWGQDVEGSHLGESLLQNGNNMNGNEGEGGGDKASANNKNDDDKDEDDSNKSYAFSQADSDYSAATDSAAIARLPLLSISKGDAASRSRPLCQLTNTQLSMLLLHFNDDELARLWKCWTKVGALGGGGAYTNRKESGDDANSSSLLRRNLSDGTIDTKTSAGSLTESNSNVHNSGMLQQPRFRTETETSDWLEASGIANITGGGGIGGLLNPLSGGLNNTTNNNQDGSLSGTEETASLGRSLPSIMPGGAGSSMDEWLFYPTHWLRLRRYSQFVVIFLGPVALVAIAAGAVTQTIQRTVYVPLAVNLFALASAYIFYEYLRAVPVLRLSGAVTKYLRLALYSCDINDATSRSVASITMLIPSSISSYLSAGLKGKSRAGTEDSARSSTTSANLNNNTSRSASTRLSRMETVDKQPKDSYHVTSLLKAAATAGQAPPPSSRSMRVKSNNNDDDNIILIDEQDGFGRESLIAGRESLGSSGGDDGMIKTFSHHRGSTSGGSGLSVISLSYYGSEGDNNSKFGGFFGMSGASGSYLQRTNDDTGMLGNGFAEADMWALHWRLRTLMGSSGSDKGTTAANSNENAAGAGAGAGVEGERERRWLSVASVSHARRLGILSSPPGGQQQEDDGVNEDDDNDVAAWLYRLAACEPCAKQYSKSESLQPELGSLSSALGALAILIVGVLFVTTIR